MVAPVSSGAKGSSQWANDVVNTITPTAWVAPTLLNSWVNHLPGTNQIARYRKIGDIVYIEGLIKNGTSGASALLLPVGYRPSFDTYFATNANGSYGSIGVLANGNVNVTGSTTYLSINCLFATT